MTETRRTPVNYFQQKYLAENEPSTSTEGYHVPEGKTFVIKTISATAPLTPKWTIRLMVDSTEDTLPPVFDLTNFSEGLYGFSASMPVHIMVPEGGYVRFVFARTGGEVFPPVYVNSSVAGYLIDNPSGETRG